MLEEFPHGEWPGPDSGRLKHPNFQRSDHRGLPLVRGVATPENKGNSKEGNVVPAVRVVPITPIDGTS